MTEITKTIQVYNPKERLPSRGCLYIATLKGHRSEEWYVPQEIFLGRIDLEGYFFMANDQSCSVRLDEKGFRERVLEWYYLPA